MLTEDFYDVINSELEIVIEENKEEISNKNLKQLNQQKGYALLIWFLKFYSPSKILHKDNITDGMDDSSCDIIFSNNENGEKIYYVVQSKWNQKQQNVVGKEPAKLHSDDVKKAILDFESILRKDKYRGKNEVFNKKLDEIHKHLAEDNGKVKFIFLSLLNHNKEIDEYIRNFESTYEPNIKFEVIDIERIKRDYIEFNFKQIKVSNPLNYQYYNPEESKITLAVERIENSTGKGDHLKVDKPYESYIFLIKPKTIYELFEKYEYSLFFNNVRNPLPESNYNKVIAKTVQEKPSMFWYFNNGITAITKLINQIGVHSEKVTLTGLQIINGAQTVYSVYSAYKEASLVEREVMDLEARITFRLIKSNDKDVNMQITRYTNSQNPMEAQDFWANDTIQIRLQEESFKTNIWFAKRRGEFRTIPDKISSENNYVFGTAYLAFWLQKPFLAERGFLHGNFDSLLFKSHRDDSEGLYEKIFNENTKFEDLLSSYFIYKVSDNFNISSEKRFSSGFFNFMMECTQSYHSEDIWLQIGLSKIVLEKYIAKKYKPKKDINLSSFILKLYNEENHGILPNVFNFIGNKLDKEFSKQNPQALMRKSDDKKIGTERISPRNIFEKLKEFFEKLDFEPLEIETSIPKKGTVISRKKVSLS